MKTLQKVCSLASCVLLALPLLAQTGKPIQSKSATTMTEATAIVLRGGKLLTISHGVIENGAVVIEGGKIIAVGAVASVAVPKNARVIDTSGMTIYPGLIDSHSQLGLTE